MQSLRAYILSYMRIKVLMRERFCTQDVNALSRLNMLLRACCTSPGSSYDQIMDRVVILVKKFSNIDATKTHTACLAIQNQALLGKHIRGRYIVGVRLDTEFLLLNATRKELSYLKNHMEKRRHLESLQLILIFSPSKDLSLDSLDRVELVMAFEQEFSIEIPDEEADKLKCCADVAKYIMSEVGHKNAESS